jgi:phage protein U
MGGDAAWAVIGDTELFLPTYADKLEGSERVVWAAHAVIEGKPVLQYIGDEAEELKLDVMLNSWMCSPAEELDRLRDMMREHKAWPLVFGNGLYKGHYVICEITVTHEVTNANGEPTALQVKIVFKEHVTPAEPETFPSPPAVSGSGPKPAAVKAATRPAASPVQMETRTNIDDVSVSYITRSGT